MNLENRLERTAFHDSTVAVMQMEGDHVHLEFENVILDTESDDYYRAIVDLGGVHRVTCGGETVNTLRVEGEGSGVVAFERSGQTATLVMA